MVVHSLLLLTTAVGLLLLSAGQAAAELPLRPLVVLTFNTGTTPRLEHDPKRSHGYGPAEAAISDQWYGNGLAWKPAIRAVRQMIGKVDPDVVAFQEIFDCRRCVAIPDEARRGFVCEDYRAGQPGVAERVLGDDYQIAYHPAKTSKCLAVHRRVGQLRTAQDQEPGEWEGPQLLEGATVAGCGSGARVARGYVDRPDGTTLTIISLHGTSGFKPADQQCRVLQIERIFVDWGDGRPGVSPQNNLILGDFNTDPYRAAELDRSAARWNDFVGPDKRFRYLSRLGPGVPPSYANLADIDHVVSDAYVGTCRRLGVDPETQAVYEGVYFDHVPIVCTLTPAASDEQAR